MIRTFHVQPARRLDINVEFTMDIDPGNHAETWITNWFDKGLCYEQEVSHVMMRVLRAGDHVIDVGANSGFFTLFMSRLVGPEGHVLAFEPSDTNLPRLKANLERNAIANVELVEQPLWNKVKDIQFFHSADSPGGDAVWDPGLWWENVQSQMVPQVRRVKQVRATILDHHAFNGPVRLVKIDTEGAEQKILEGAEGFLTEHNPPFIVLELNPFGQKQLDSSNEGLRAFLREFGYECFLIHTDGSLPSLVPPNAEITHQTGSVVMNVLFSDLHSVGEMWSKVPFDDPG